MTRHDNPWNIRSVSICGGQAGGGPRHLGPGKDSGWTHVEVKNDKVNEAEVDRVPLRGAARRCAMRSCAVEGAAGEEVPKRGSRPRRSRLALRPVLAEDDTPRLVQITLLR